MSRINTHAAKGFSKEDVRRTVVIDEGPPEGKIGDQQSDHQHIVMWLEDPFLVGLSKGDDWGLAILPPRSMIRYIYLLKACFPRMRLSS